MSINKQLQKKILEMLKVDQAVRKRQMKEVKKLRQNFDFGSKQYKKEIQKLAAEMAMVDKKHTTEIKKIIKSFGWPGFKLVGKRGSFGAWIIVQHATHDLEFQKECLPLLKEAVAKNDADPKNLAFLIDRIKVLENKKQIYGTQFKGSRSGKYNPFPIYDKKNLNKRRKKMGLGPFTKYQG